MNNENTAERARSAPTPLVAVQEEGGSSKTKATITMAGKRI